MLPCFSFFKTFPKLKSFVLSNKLHVSANDSINPQGKFNWNRSSLFWKSILRDATLDKSNKSLSFIVGDNKFGVTNLNEINQSGFISGEYTSKDSRYTKTKTYALRFGYNGDKFLGYQSQRNISAITVEDIIHKVIKKTTVAAGRTDKGVSAISQIVSFSSPIDNFQDAVMKEFNNEKYCQEGDLVVYDCVRVPRKFNGLFM
jgi:hypothetical protein